MFRGWSKQPTLQLHKYFFAFLIQGTCLGAVWYVRHDSSFWCGMSWFVTNGVYWLQVEYAITFFKSLCTNPTLPANADITPPPFPSITKLTLQHSNKYPELINKDTPTFTIVTAWINAETGVGPSIASANQVCNPNCTDFPTAPQK